MGRGLLLTGRLELTLPQVFPAADTQLAVHGVQAGPDRLIRDMRVGGDLFVGQATRRQPGYFSYP